VEALATLDQAGRLSRGAPADLAYLAMAEQFLGRKEQARASLGSLRQVLAKPEGVKDDKARALLREAETVLGAEADQPK